METDRPLPVAAFAAPVMLALLTLLVVLVAGAAPPDEATPRPAASNGVEMNDAERAFSESLAGAVLTGRFTTDGEEAPPKPEKYQIVSATKTNGDNWLIVARISYGKADVPAPALPIPVQVHWAGDTPILSLTDLTIPGFGTFSSRVMFAKGRYAGTWQHGDKGGHLFGKYAKPEGEAEETKPAE